MGTPALTRDLGCTGRTEKETGCGQSNLDATPSGGASFTGLLGAHQMRGWEEPSFAEISANRLRARGNRQVPPEL